MQSAIKSQLIRINLGILSSVACVAIAAGLMFGGAGSRSVEAAGGTGSADAPSVSGNELIPEKSRRIAPALAIIDVEGRPITLAKYRGKVVLLDFWAVNCGGCKLEIPWYVQFDQKYRRKGLQLIGIDMYGESASVIKPFMETSHMTYPVAVRTDSIGQRFHVQEMPLTLLIDRQGRIAYSHAGVVDRNSFERDVKALLR